MLSLPPRLMKGRDDALANLERASGAALRLRERARPAADATAPRLRVDSHFWPAHPARFRADGADTGLAWIGKADLDKARALLSRARKEQAI
jgi:hypothetical protein